MEIKILRKETDGKYNGRFNRISISDLQRIIKTGYTINMTHYIANWSHRGPTLRKLKVGFEIKNGKTWRKISDTEGWRIINLSKELENGYGDEIEVFPFKWWGR